MKTPTQRHSEERQGTISKYTYNLRRNRLGFSRPIYLLMPPHFGFIFHSIYLIFNILDRNQFNPFNCRPPLQFTYNNLIGIKIMGCYIGCLGRCVAITTGNVSNAFVSVLISNQVEPGIFLALCVQVETGVFFIGRLLTHLVDIKPTTYPSTLL